LDELLKISRLVGGFTNDLNDNGIGRSLGIDIGDADFAVLEVEITDTFLDGL